MLKIFHNLITYIKDWTFINEKVFDEFAWHI